MHAKKTCESESEEATSAETNGHFWLLPLRRLCDDPSRRNVKHRVYRMERFGISCTWGQPWKDTPSVKKKKKTRTSVAESYKLRRKTSAASALVISTGFKHCRTNVGSEMVRIAIQLGSALRFLLDREEWNLGYRWDKQIYIWIKCILHYLIIVCPLFVVEVQFVVLFVINIVGFYFSQMVKQVVQ